MQSSAAKDHILDKALSIDHEQFEQLCKMIIERAEQTRELELTPFRADGGIDVHAVIDRDLFHARLGVQAKQYSSSNTVGRPSIQTFKGALSDEHYHIGTFITTSSYSTAAVESAEQDYIRLVDGEMLADIMVNSEIGVLHRGDGTYETDSEFWDVFRKPEDSDIIPSLEVPQADNFDVIRLVLQSIDAGSDVKHDIAQYVSSALGESFDPRQADYYGMAAWLLGFVHKEKRIQLENRKVRRWGLTREGEEYLEYLNRDNTAAASDLLHEAIRNVEVVHRIYTHLEDAGQLRRDEIATILAEETELSGSTTGRRAHTVGAWLVQLPEIRTEGGGASQKYEYVNSNLSDFSP